MTKNPHIPPRVISRSDVFRMLAHRTRMEALTPWLDRRNQAIIALVYTSGASVADIRTIKVLDGAGEELTLSCIFPVTDWAMGLVSDWYHSGRTQMRNHTDRAELFLTRTGAPMGGKSVLRVVKKRGEAAGIPGVTPKALRNSYGAHMLDNGASVKDVRKAMRHIKLETTAKLIGLSRSIEKVEKAPSIF